MGVPEGAETVMQVLKTGLGPKKVITRYMKYANEVVAAGVTFEGINDSSRPAVRDLIDAHVRGLNAGWQVSPDDGGLIARDRDGVIIGALLVSASVYQRPRPGYVVGSIRAVAVDPIWRGRGVGVVLLGQAPQAYSPLDPSFYMGNCTRSDAAFYAKAGYTVLMPGEIMQLPFGNQSFFGIQNPEYPCFFYRG